MDASLACMLARALFDRRKDLVEANASAMGIGLDTAGKKDYIPPHRGAVKVLTMLGANGTSGRQTVAPNQL